MKHYYRLLLTLLLLLPTGATRLQAQDFGDLIGAVMDKEDEPKDDKAKEDKDDKGKKYSDVIKNPSKTVRGFIDLHLQKGKVYMEIPVALLDRPMLFTGRVDAISDNTDVIAGEMPAEPLMVSWSKDDERLYLHQLNTAITADPESSIYKRVQDNHLMPVLSAFKIATWRPDSTAVVIDATSLFLTDKAPITPFLPKSPFDSFFGANKLSGSFKKDLSSITDISAFPRNLNVTVRAVYTVDKEPFTAVINASLGLLPDDKDMMRPRLHDYRIGYFTNGTTKITTDALSMEKVKYINRWRLEPKPEDIERHKRGELVVPAKPIVYYVDDAFPVEWYPYLKQGIEDWQKAFEAIGFKDAIVAKRYPKDDPSFNPNDIRYTCLIYSSSQQANAMGPSWTDPRTGEILQASVYFYHNVLELIHDWRFCQTAAADPSARGLHYELSVLGPMLRYIVAHEVGHTLGLMHNMGASSSYRVEDLRSPDFTTKYGTTPSIMDYARYNYVAQPGDGVTNFLPPLIGMYDMYAIAWGYKPIYEAATPEEERPILNRWITEKQGDRRFAYGPQQILSNADYTAQTEDLGDDPVLASYYGIENLKRTVDHLFDWTPQEDGKAYKAQDRLLSSLAGQFRLYIGHATSVIGGFRRNLPVHGDGQTKYSVPSRKEQQRALRFVLDQSIDFPRWMSTKEVTAKLGKQPNNFSDQIFSTMSMLTGTSVLSRLSNTALYSEERNPYTPEAYLADLHDYVWQNGGALTPVERNMQYAYVSQLLSGLGLDGKKSNDKQKLKTQAINVRGPLYKSLLGARSVISSRMGNHPEAGHYADLYYMIDRALSGRN